MKKYLFTPNTIVVNRSKKSIRWIDITFLLSVLEIYFTVFLFLTFSSYYQCVNHYFIKCHNVFGVILKPKSSVVWDLITKKSVRVFGFISCRPGTWSFCGSLCYFSTNSLWKRKGWMSVKKNWFSNIVQKQEVFALFSHIMICFYYYNICRHY